MGHLGVGAGLQASAPAGAAKGLEADLPAASFWPFHCPLLRSWLISPNWLVHSCLGFRACHLGHLSLILASGLTQSHNLSQGDVSVEPALWALSTMNGLALRAIGAVSAQPMVTGPAQ